MSPRRPTAAVLMEHQAFLKRLARSLVFDDQRAEDIVQDSFVVALERAAPAPEGLRGWLAGIVRNSARRVLRTERRQRDRQRRGARSEAVASTADIAARLEAQRVIAAAVESLDEPGRSALVYRYFDGHKPARIARDLDVPVRTVESRLRRARASLRDVLDEQFGDRNAWHLALVPLLGGAPAASALTGAGASGGTSTSAAATTAWGVTIMSANTTAVIAIVAALAGAGIGWGLKPATLSDYEGPPEEAVEPPQPQPLAPELGTDASLVSAAQTRADNLAKEVEEAHKENARLRAELAAARTGVQAPTDPAEHAKAAAELKVPRFRYEKVDEALLGIDWKKTATSMRELAPLLPKLAQALADGHDFTSVMSRITEFNTPLIQVAATLKGANVPGDGLNGAFTHPSVVVNAVYATLIDAGKPLDEAQTELLRALGDQFVAEDLAMRLRNADEPFALAKFLQESELKDRLYKAIDELVTPEQRTVLHPEGLRDRVQTDLFCSGLLWMAHLDAARGSTRDELTTRVVASAMRTFKIPETDRPGVERAVGDWLRAFDDASMPPLDKYEAKNFIRMDRVRKAAGPMLALYKELAREMASQPKVAQRIRDAAYVILPVLTRK